MYDYWAEVHQDVVIGLVKQQLAFILAISHTSFLQKKTEFTLRLTDLDKNKLVWSSEKSAVLLFKKWLGLIIAKDELTIN